MDYELITPRYTHWRASEALASLHTGKPDVGDVKLYSRSNGWYPAGLTAEDRRMWNMWVKPAARGGVTLCQLIDQYGQTLAAGVALCSFSDNFCYATGRTLAAGRALQALGKLIEEIPEV